MKQDLHTIAACPCLKSPPKNAHKMHTGTCMPLKFITNAVMAPRDVSTESPLANVLREDLANTT